MYKILIADDETIILSGIKFLIDWEENDCVIIETARNGQDALQKIRANPPDIIFCDINMPVMSGMELIQILQKEFPVIVVVMLTNLHEFHLVQDSLRLRVVDYLLKSQLEAAGLIKSLNVAKAECDNRNKFLKISQANEYLRSSGTELLQDAFLKVLFEPNRDAFQKAAAYLAEQRKLSHYGMLYIFLDFSHMPNSDQFIHEDRKKLVVWEKELADKLGRQIFQDKYVFAPIEHQTNCLIMLCWEQNRNWEQNVKIFADKLSNASANIMQAVSTVFSTACFNGRDELLRCRDELLILIELYYLDITEKPSLQTTKSPYFEPLGLNGIGSRLEAELNEKNLNGVLLLLDKASERISGTTHQRGQAIWLCNELYRSVARTLHDGYFADSAGYREIENLMTRKQVLQWIEKLRNAVIEMLRQYSDEKALLMEKARQYILDNVEKHISLQEVADHVCISAGYMSTLFKRQFGQSLVDFINRAKIERACLIIQEDKYLINEIAFRLGFENSYYFAKIFKRYMGCSPSEYHRKVQDEKLKNG